MKEALKKKQLVRLTFLSLSRYLTNLHCAIIQDAAKAIVSAQTRAKKERRNDREVAKKERAIAVETGEVDPLARKRVSFA